MITIESIFNVPTFADMEVAEIERGLSSFAENYCPAAYQFITPARQFWYNGQQKMERLS
jgi:hypothetical protein